MYCHVLPYTVTVIDREKCVLITLVRTFGMTGTEADSDSVSLTAETRQPP